MKAYSVYKNINLEWADRIPDHWKSVNLRWVAEIFAGGTPSKDKTEYWENGTIPWIASGEVNQGYITSPTTYITDEGFHNSSAKWIPKDSLVMALAGQGKTKAMVAQLGISTTCNQSLAAIVPLRIGSRYLFYWLQSNYYRIRGLVGDGLRDGLNLEIIGSLPALLPSLSEQQAIADFLDRKTQQIDTLIAKKQRQIELLEEQRTALINQAVTKGLNADVPMKDSGVAWLGEIPSHWEIVHLRWITKSVTTGKTPPTIQQEYYENADINWFCPGDFNHQLILHESKKKINNLAVNDGQPLYEKDTVLVVGIGATLGKIGILEEIGSSNQQINAIFYNQRIFPLYGAYYLNAIKEVIVSQANFATLPILNQSQTKDLLHLVPSYEEQIKIVKFIQDKDKQMQKLILLQEKIIDCYKEYRTALISEAVTGKIDVRE